MKGICQFLKVDKECKILECLYEKRDVQVKSNLDYSEGKIFKFKFKTPIKIRANEYYMFKTRLLGSPTYQGIKGKKIS